MEKNIEILRRKGRDTTGTFRHRMERLLFMPNHSWKMVAR